MKLCVVSISEISKDHHHNLSAEYWCNKKEEKQNNFDDLLHKEMEELKMKEEKECTVKKSEFQKFRVLQMQGICNMLSSQVRDITGLTKDQHQYIIEHYSELEEMYNVNN